MIEERIKELFALEYEKHILISDKDNFLKFYNYFALLKECGFKIIEYGDPEQFAYTYETQLRNTGEKYAVIAYTNITNVPYYAASNLYCLELSLGKLYPRLNSETLKKNKNDFDIIDFTYDSIYENHKSQAETESYIKNTVFNKNNVDEFIKKLDTEIKEKCENATSYINWIEIAKLNAKSEYYAVKADIDRDQTNINSGFAKFLKSDYSKLSGIVSSEFPSILPKAIGFCSGKKFALIVADGMSLFDFTVISYYLSDFEYKYNCSYAMIPTVTSISRQSLLSGKYPQQLENPFSLSGEEKEFYKAAADNNYSKEASCYGRGYEQPLSPITEAAAIIVNDVDDAVHAQLNGRKGMLDAIDSFAKSGKLQKLIKSYTNEGFTVYLTSDHGNTECIGTGLLRGLGIETETRSHRMVVMKEFGNANDKIANNTFLYPGYYLNKNYKYYICKNNLSFDIKDEKVMTHGGITLEEVIVPFIEFKAKG